MATNSEIFIDWIDRVLGPEVKILKHECPRGGPPVSVFVFRDIPEKGMITGVTYGLSFYPHLDWKYSRPEMIISIESSDTSWAFAAAFFTAEFRGEKRFCYGDLFTTEDPLADDTEMDGLLVFAQSLFDPEDALIQLNDYKINLSQFYPIYRSEIPVYEKIGLEAFWNHPQFGLYDPKRKAINT